MSQTDSGEAVVASEVPSESREDPLRKQDIRVVTDADSCREVITQLQEHCREFPVLGFDCEWVKKGADGKHNRVALMQMATHKGLCALIRLNKMNEIPPELGDLLNDASILKVGIDPFDDANLLVSDYGVSVQSTLDLRHLACKCGHPELDGLKKLAEHILGVTMNKQWRLRASNWEDDELNDMQKKYAADDVHVAVELFRKLGEKLGMGSSTDIKGIIDEFKSVFDQKYRRPKQKKKSSK